MASLRIPVLEGLRKLGRVGGKKSAQACTDPTDLWFSSQHQIVHDSPTEPSGRGSRNGLAGDDDSQLFRRRRANKIRGASLSFPLKSH
jgi:hypothetical protein